MLNSLYLTVDNAKVTYTAVKEASRNSEVKFGEVTKTKVTVFFFVGVGWGSGWC